MPSGTSDIKHNTFYVIINVLLYTNCNIVNVLPLNGCMMSYRGDQSVN